MQTRYAELSPVSVRDVLLRQIRGAHRAQIKPETLTDETVYQIRKKLKRARASLRLLRDAVGKSVYARENAALRDAAQPLGGVRDAKAALDALENFRAYAKKAPRAAVLTELRRVLQEARLSLRREIQRTGDLEASARSVEAARRRVEKWRVPVDGSTVVRKGIDRIYRQGRKALAQLESNRSDENLHELRKQGKYLGQAMEIFKALKAPGLAKRIRRAKLIADCLGEDHDLAILQDRIAELSGDPHAAYKRVIASIDNRRKKLQRKALKQSRSLYKKKANAFIERFKTQAYDLVRPGPDSGQSRYAPSPARLREAAA
jgi:CHAD domain-containing protein